MTVAEIPVEQVTVGTTIVLPNGEQRKVVAVERYEDDSYVVVYGCNILNRLGSRPVDADDRRRPREDAPLDERRRPGKGGRLMARRAVDRPTENMLRLARANVARRLVADSLLHPLDALAYTVWPTARIAEVEATLSYGTLTSRAFAARSNP